jgi:6-phosphogluconolactonase
MNAPIRYRAEWHEFGSPDELAEALAKRIARSLAQAIAERGHASLAVSGGRTPKQLFQALSFAPVEWEKVTVVLVDERFVPPDDERSNERLVRSHLLRYRAGKARLLPLYRKDVSVEEAATLADAAMAAVPMPFDVAVLGMGADGHTASFFPDAPNLETLYRNTEHKSVLPVRAASAVEPRLTLSLQVLAAAKLVVVHIQSDERKSILIQALADGALPIARLFAEAASAPQIYWAPEQ